MSEPTFHSQSQVNFSADIDRENAFLLYAANCGDVVKTAAALSIDSVILLRVIDEEGWTKKLEPILALIKSQKPQDLERGLNRCLNYVQSHRLRLVLERALRLMTSWTDEQLREEMLTTTPGKFGDTKRFSTRWAADFASAMEKVHSMSYQALNDTASERVKRKDDASSEGSALDLHARIAQAMAGAGASKTPRALLFDAQLVQANAVAATVTPRKPEDDAYEQDG